MPPRTTKNGQTKRKRSKSASVRAWKKEKRRKRDQLIAVPTNSETSQSIIKPPKRSYIYLLRSKYNTIYVGFTYNLLERLRKHNGIISGGARKNRYRRPLQLMMYLTAPRKWLTKSCALRLEWMIGFLTKQLHKRKTKPSEYKLDKARIFKGCPTKHQPLIKHINSIVWMLHQYTWLFHNKEEWKLKTNPLATELPHTTIQSMNLKWRLHPDISNIIDMEKLRVLATDTTSLWPVATLKTFRSKTVKAIQNIMDSAVIEHRSNKK